MRMLMLLVVVVIFAMAPLAVQAEESVETRLNRLAEEVSRQAEMINRQQIIIQELQTELQQQKKRAEARETMSAATGNNTVAAGEEGAGKGGSFFGGSALTNPNISAVVNTFGYASNLDNDQLSSQGIPGFTTRGLSSQRGYNLDSVELSLFAPVDPYFNLYINMPVSDDGISVEEAFAVTTFLPEGFQAKGGRFKSNFSRLDAQHPHAWDFTDIALPYRAFLGSEGLGGENGLQLTWLPPLSLYTQLGAEVLQGQNDLLFGSSASSNPHAFTLFGKSSFDLSDNSTILLGPYVLFGKTNNSNIVPDGPVDASSVLTGFEGIWKWQPYSGQSLTLQGEYLYLSQDGNVTSSTASGTESLQRRQDGFYLQGIHRFDRWGVAARFGALNLLADTFKQNGSRLDNGRPWNASLSTEFNPSEFSRIRLQYSHDRSDPSGYSNNSLTLQLLFGIGAHAAHPF